MKTNFYFLLSLFLVLGLSSCDDDEPECPIIPNEEEVITTMTYTLTPDGGGETVVLSFLDLDGDGGNDPIITGDTLTANTTYTGALDLLNQAENPAESITEEVEEEAEEHQFFFSSTLADLTVAYGDSDAEGNPLGLVTSVTTGAAGSGMLTVILRHEPAKDAAGVSDGDITNAGGETDIEVDFPVNVQ
ncbi:MAG: type 1 periplasmic binding fold superfamily protein [Flavobacteriales bacterium]